jgi:hypothetical protein
MFKVEAGVSIEKIVGSVLLLSFIYNLLYNLSLVDIDQFLLSECDFEIVKFAVINFIMSYLATFILFFGLSINRWLLYLSTTIAFALTILSSKYFLSFYERLTFKDVYFHKLSAPLWPIICSFFLGWYLVYYISGRNIVSYSAKILMSCCLILYIAILCIYTLYPNSHKPYFITKMTEIIHVAAVN